MIKTKCVHVTTGLSDGGAEAVLYQLCTTSNSHQHIVISLMDDGKYGPLLREAGISVYALGMPRGRLVFAGLWRLWRILRRERPDLVQTWMYHANLVGGVFSRLAGIRAICWGIHNTSTEPALIGRSTFLVSRVCAILSRWIPCQIVCCAHRAVVTHQVIGYDAERCVVIPNGYDVARFRPDRVASRSVRQALSVSDTHPCIGLVARFDRQKDHANLIAALARVSAVGWEFETLLVGTGMDTNNRMLMELIEVSRLSNSVHLLGQRDDITSVMNALDLHVMSSVHEAFPNVLAEAMACGTPCVTTDVGDAALIVGDTGWVVPPRDPEALAGAVVEALRERQDAKRWAVRQAAARDRIADQFSLETMVSSYEHVWRRCLEG
jgi:glycosyltransferase involved in cell wall biosynthesis